MTVKRIGGDGGLYQVGTTPGGQALAVGGTENGNLRVEWESKLSRRHRSGEMRGKKLSGVRRRVKREGKKKMLIATVLDKGKNKPTRERGGDGRRGRDSPLGAGLGLINKTRVLGDE